ncbi:ATP-binding cassette domain-containing protein, partial [Klebsiella pneumoniae]
NGVGKSTLIKILTGEIVPDDGQVKWQKNIKVGYLDQYAKLTPGMTLKSFLKTAFADLFAQEEKLNNLYVEYSEKGD